MKGCSETEAISEDQSVSHLTLKVHDTSDDDLIFVKVLQAPLTESTEPESGQ